MRKPLRLWHRLHEKAVLRETKMQDSQEKWTQKNMTEA